ncbi:MAG: prolipoprotein diacylglyceryl transferase [Anaerolineaceae bacterium]|nr:prolipoprotein diacylglyceryl transferase [Anaerolineaceae bacterium]
MNLFSLALGIGATVGLASILWRAGDMIRAPHLVDAGLLTLFGALLGSRVGFVIANWLYFQFHWNEIPQIWLGGLSAAGALVGGMISLPLSAQIACLPLRGWLDRMSPMLPPLAVGAWLAAWAAGSAYGPLAESAWWALPARDEWGSIELRWPIQFAGALITLGLFSLIDINHKRLRRSGQTGSLSLLALLLPYAAASFLRADPAIPWLGLRPEIWTGLFISLICLGICLVFFWPTSWRTPRTQREVHKIVPEKAPSSFD